ncbi:hypothetical protein CBM2633_A10285 [Cupriavidus taiwanensis]|nr:hypothetical protein CBM2633_A10285 [Cupriavidus taiwanensis]
MIRAIFKSYPNSDFLVEIDVMSDRWLSVEEIAEYLPAALALCWLDNADPLADGRVHAKVAVADGRMCFITSANPPGTPWKRTWRLACWFLVGALRSCLRNTCAHSSTQDCLPGLTILRVSSPLR